MCEGGICQDGCEDVDECKEGKDECSAEPIRQADGSIVASERCVNTIGSYVCLAWNATTCTGPAAVADTDRPEVKGILGLNGRVPLFGDKSTPGSSPIKSYYWTLVRAPDGAQPRLTSVTSSTAQASQLSKQGEYVFEVAVTDNCGEVGRATVRVNKLLGMPSFVKQDSHCSVLFRIGVAESLWLQMRRQSKSSHPLDWSPIQAQAHRDLHLHPA